MSVPACSFMAWHYTSAEGFLEILRKRALIPSMTLGEAKSRPVVWFSVNPEFEPSMLLSGSTSHDHGRDAPLHTRATEGDVRLGVPVRTLLTCADVRRVTGMSDEAWSELCEQARVLGSDPDQWFASMRRIPQQECMIEVFERDGRWHRMQYRGERSPVARGEATVRHRLARTHA